MSEYLNHEMFRNGLTKQGWESQRPETLEGLMMLNIDNDEETDSLISEAVNIIKTVNDFHFCDTANDLTTYRYIFASIYDQLDLEDIAAVPLTRCYKCIDRYVLLENQYARAVRISDLEDCDEVLDHVRKIDISRMCNSLKRARNNNSPSIDSSLLSHVVYELLVRDEAWTFSTSNYFGHKLHMEGSVNNELLNELQNHSDSIVTDVIPQLVRDAGREVLPGLMCRLSSRTSVWRLLTSLSLESISSSSSSGSSSWKPDDVHWNLVVLLSEIRDQLKDLDDVPKNSVSEESKLAITRSLECLCRLLMSPMMRSLEATGVLDNLACVAIDILKQIKLFFDKLVFCDSIGHRIFTSIDPSVQPPGFTGRAVSPFLKSPLFHVFMVAMGLLASTNVIYSREALGNEDSFASRLETAFASSLQVLEKSGWLLWHAYGVASWKSAPSVADNNLYLVDMTINGAFIQVANSLRQYALLLQTFIQECVSENKTLALPAVQGLLKQFVELSSKFQKPKYRTCTVPRYVVDDSQLEYAPSLKFLFDSSELIVSTQSQLECLNVPTENVATLCLAVYVKLLHLDSFKFQGGDIRKQFLAKHLKDTDSLVRGFLLSASIPNAESDAAKDFCKCLVRDCMEAIQAAALIHRKEVADVLRLISSFSCVFYSHVSSRRREAWGIPFSPSGKFVWVVPAGVSVDSGNSLPPSVESLVLEMPIRPSSPFYTYVTGTNELDEVSSFIRTLLPEVVANLSGCKYLSEILLECAYDIMATLSFCPSICPAIMSRALNGRDLFTSSSDVPTNVKDQITAQFTNLMSNATLWTSINDTEKMVHAIFYYLCCYLRESLVQFGETHCSDADADDLVFDHLVPITMPLLTCSFSLDAFLDFGGTSSRCSYNPPTWMTVPSSKCSVLLSELFAGGQLKSEAFVKFTSSLYCFINAPWPPEVTYRILELLRILGGAQLDNIGQFSRVLPDHPVILCGPANNLAAISHTSSQATTPLDYTNMITLSDTAKNKCLDVSTKLFTIHADDTVQSCMLLAITNYVQETTDFYSSLRETAKESGLLELLKFQSDSGKSQVKTLELAAVFSDPYWNFCFSTLPVLWCMDEVLDRLEIIMDDVVSGTPTLSKESDSEVYRRVEQVIDMNFVVWNFFRTFFSNGPVPYEYKYRCTSTDKQVVDDPLKVFPMFEFHFTPRVIFVTFFNAFRKWLDLIAKTLEHVKAIKSNAGPALNNVVNVHIHMLKQVAFANYKNGSHKDWMAQLLLWLKVAQLISILEVAQTKKMAHLEMSDLESAWRTGSRIGMDARNLASVMGKVYRALREYTDEPIIISPRFQPIFLGKLTAEFPKVLSLLNAGGTEVPLAILHTAEPSPKASSEKPKASSDVSSRSNKASKEEKDTAVNKAPKSGSMAAKGMVGGMADSRISNMIINRRIGNNMMMSRKIPSSLADRLRNRTTRKEALSAEELMSKWRESTPCNVGNQATTTKFSDTVGPPPSVRMMTPDHHMNKRGMNATSNESNMSTKEAAAAAFLDIPALTAEEKDAIWQKSDQQVNLFLRQVMEWNIYDLESFELPELMNIRGKIPICFENENDFRKYYRPLILDECRCAIAQELLERKLDPRIVSIESIATSAEWLTATIKSIHPKTGPDGKPMVDPPAATPEDINQQRGKMYERLPFKPHDLILFAPLEANGSVHPLAGRTLGTPPPNGYWLGVVWKPREKKGAVNTTSTTRPDNGQWCFVQFPKHLPGGSHQVNRIPSTGVAIESSWAAFSLASLTTSVREFQALHTACFSKLFRFLLNPQNYGFKRENHEAASDSGASMTPFMQRLKKKTLPSEISASIDTVCKHCNLNENQALAVRHSLDPDYGLALLQGPPGTGKTKTLIAILAGLYCSLSSKSKPQQALQSKILICAPSNAAVDEIASRVIQEGLMIPGRGTIHPCCLRVGNPQKITREEVLKISLEAKLSEQAAEIREHAKEETETQLEKISSRLNELETELAARNLEAQSLAISGDSSGGDMLLENRQTLADCYNERRKLATEKRKLKGTSKDSVKESIGKRRDAILAGADIFFATLSGSASELLSTLTFSCVIVDEAAQAVELSGLIPLRHSVGSVILIGDPQQLPATVLSKNAKKFSYERSLFQRMQLCGVDVVMLTTQYRMRAQISAFPSSMFYYGRLRNDISVLKRPPLRCQAQWTTMFGPFKFFDVPSSESKHSITQSLVNVVEAEFIVSLLACFARNFLGKKDEQQYTPVTLDDIVVVSPYKQQVNEISNRLHAQSRFFEKYSPSPIEVCTIDSFQGREKKVIVFSCVRSLGASGLRAISTPSWASDDEDSTVALTAQSSARTARERESEAIKTIGFVADIRRLNVAITRARDCLWIVGNAETLKVHETWAALVSHAKQSASSDPEDTHFVDLQKQVGKLPMNTNSTDALHKAIINAYIEKEERKFKQSSVSQRKSAEQSSPVATKPMPPNPKPTSPAVVNNINKTAPDPLSAILMRPSVEVPPPWKPPPTASAFGHPNNSSSTPAIRVIDDPRLQQMTKTVTTCRTVEIVPGTPSPRGPPVDSLLQKGSKKRAREASGAQASSEPCERPQVKVMAVSGAVRPAPTRVVSMPAEARLAPVERHFGACRPAAPAPPPPAVDMKNIPGNGLMNGSSSMPPPVIIQPPQPQPVLGMTSQGLSCNNNPTLYNNKPQRIVPPPHPGFVSQTEQPCQPHQGRGSPPGCAGGVAFTKSSSSFLGLGQELVQNSLRLVSNNLVSGNNNNNVSWGGGGIMAPPVNMGSNVYYPGVVSPYECTPPPGVVNGKFNGQRFNNPPPSGPPPKGGIMPTSATVVDREFSRESSRSNAPQ